MPGSLDSYEVVEKLPGGTAAQATYVARRADRHETVELRVTKGCAHAAACFDGCGTGGGCGGKARKARKVLHPNLERVREYATERGLLVTVTDHRAARSLRDFLAEREGIDADVALDLLLPVGLALAEVHEAGFVHGAVLADQVRVEEGTDRAYLPHVPGCSSMGLYQDAECRPQDNPDCPVGPATHWPPRLGDDIQAFLGLLAGAVGGPEQQVFEDGLADIDPMATTMPEVLDRLRLLRVLIQEHRDLRRGKVSMMNMKLRQRKLETRAMVRPELPERGFWGRVNEAFDRLSAAGRAGLFVVVAAASFPVPAVDQVLASTQASTEAPAAVPAIAAVPRPAKPKAPPAPQATAPKLAPEAAAVVALAEEAWKAPTDEGSFASRLKVVWAYFKSLSPEGRNELGGKEALLEIRKQAARSTEGYGTLDRLIARCRDLVQAEQRRAAEQAQAKAPPPPQPQAPVPAAPSPGRS